MSDRTGAATGATGTPALARAEALGARGSAPAEARAAGADTDIGADEAALSTGAISLAGGGADAEIEPVKPCVRGVAARPMARGGRRYFMFVRTHRSRAVAVHTGESLRFTLESAPVCGHVVNLLLISS